jgi:2',3'-cyclic-nucleotide 2'-phosphodiesterase (5'-nucleotidase family)
MRSEQGIKGPHHRLALALAIAALLIGAPMTGAQDQALVVDGLTPAVFLLYTGDVIGYLDVCGCKKNPAGGLPRRVWVLNEIKTKFPSAPLALVDSGNFSDNPTPRGDIKTRALLDAMQRMGYGAVNVGERDIKLGYEDFKRRAGDSELTFVSANIVRQDTQEPIFPTYAVIDAISADGSIQRKVGVTGVARFNPLFLKPGPDGSNMVIAHPVDRVRAEVETLRSQGVDVVVLLAALHKDDALKIVAEVSGIDFVIGAYGGVFTQQAEKVNDSYIVYSGNQGKRFGETRVFFSPDGGIKGQATVLHFLTRQYPFDQPMLDFVNEVIGEEDAAGRQSSVESPRPEDGYAGSSACKSCHSGAFAQWEQTAHARAHDTLAKDGKQGDANCQSCHVTGAGHSGGFENASATPDLASVGCESCHGPGKGHVRQPSTSYGATTLTTCVGCHDVTNSPKFDYYAYLPQVTHTGRATAHRASD